MHAITFGKIRTRNDAHCSQSEPPLNNHIMIEQQRRQNLENKGQEDSFDESMAALFVLITHHSLTQCEHAVPNIVERFLHNTEDRKL